jgi:sporulation protein YlmC with PRC-barrel domain
MEIPLQAPVDCTDGMVGRSLYVLINPITDEATHLVVQEDTSSNEYLVPVEKIIETIAGTIRLRCSREDLEKMEPFIRTTFIEKNVTEREFGYGGDMYGMGAFYYMPYVVPEMTVKVPVNHKQIPPGELAVHRGTRVEATDGYVGQVDEFVVNPENCHITHLVMREGHLWGKKDVIIPVSAMGDAMGDKVFLKLDKRQIESLETFPLRRRWA